LGAVKAVNGGTAVKEAKKSGWKSGFQWNKNKNGWKVECPTNAAKKAGDVYYMHDYHDSFLDASTDYIGIVSEEGFKNTGLNNGENHLKCWVRGSGVGGNFGNTGIYTKKWTPNFGGDDGQSIQGWASTGTAQVVHLDDSHLRYPTNDVCGFTVP